MSGITNQSPLHTTHKTEEEEINSLRGYGSSDDSCPSDTTTEEEDDDDREEEEEEDDIVEMKSFEKTATSVKRRKSSLAKMIAIVMDNEEEVSFSFKSQHY